MTYSVRTDRKLIRHNGNSTRYVLVHIEAPAASGARARPPVNISFVLDRSGSMDGSKIQLARQAIGSALASLRGDDRFSVVAYDDQIDLVVESTPASGEAKRNALRQLERIGARGSTDLGGGWLRGCEQVALHATESTLDRCLLLTDGLANVGITDHDELERHATELRSRGVATTTFGVGADFDETLLQRMAQAGGGHFYYVETAGQIPDYIASEVGEALQVVARDAAITVVGPVGVEPLTAHAAHKSGDATLVRLGDLTADQELDVVLKLTFPEGTVGEEKSISLRLFDEDGALGGATETLSWRYGDTAANDRQRRDRVVDRQVARLYAARARRDAADLNRHGRFEEARAVLQATPRRIRSYAGREAELGAIAAELEAELPLFSVAMDPSSRKGVHASANYVLSSRSPLGQARKHPPEA